MLSGEPLVPEIAVDFEHSLEAAHGEALEVQLRGDAQEERHVQSIVMGDEGLGRSASGNDVHHGGFHLHEASLLKEAAHRTHHLRAHPEGVPGRLIHDEIKIAPAVAQLRVCNAVVLIRKGPQGLGQQPGLREVQVEITLPRLLQRARAGDDIANIPLSYSVPEPVLGPLRQVELNASGAFLEHQEGPSAVHQAPGQGDPKALSFERRLLPVAIARLQQRRRMLRAVRVAAALEVVGEIPAVRPEPLQLAPAPGHLLRFARPRGLTVLSHGDSSLLGRRAKARPSSWLQ